MAAAKNVNRDAACVSCIRTGEYFFTEIRAKDFLDGKYGFDLLTSFNNSFSTL